MSDSVRSIKSFGVAGCLRENCTVFYTSDFRSRNVGRFSDLIAAKMREVNADELRVRALLLFSLYEGYAALGKTFHAEVEVPPVSLEIGYDSGMIAIGVSFHWKEGRSPILPNVVERVPRGAYQTPFEEVLGFLRQHCAQLILKYENRERRLEIVTLLDRTDGDRRDAMEVVEIDSATAPYAEAGQYVEMGDLDYVQLTREELVPDAQPEATDESIRIEGEAPSSEAEKERTFAADEEIEALISRVDGVSASSEESEVRVKGSSSAESNEEIRLGSDPQIVEEEKETRISGNAPHSDPTTSVDASAGNAPPGEGEGWGISLLKQIWPFSEGEEQGDPSVSTEKVAEEVSAEPSPLPAVPETEVNGDGKTLEIIQELKALADDKSGSATFKQVVQEIEKEVDSKKSQRWVEGLMGELLQEKAKLAEISRQLTLQARQNELDYRGKERALQTEIRGLTEQMRRKDNQLDRNRALIAQMNQSMEQLKTSSSSTDEQQFKLRLNAAHKIAQNKDDENKVLAQKVKALEDRLIVAQAKSSRPTVDPQMTARLQASEKKIEEYKRLNQRLMENLNQQQRQAGGDKDAQGMRRKVETMERQSIELRKNLEKSQFKIRELQDSERKLQLDLSKALEENRKLRGGRGSSEAA